MQIDYLALARVGITNPDHKPDGSGLDDGPPLPRAIVNSSKREQAIAMRKMGLSVRHIGGALSVSHDTAHQWTRNTPKGSAP